MKKKILVVTLTLLLVFSLVFAVACEKHEHEWSAWTLSTEPTETEVGVASRSCSCGEVDVKSDVAVLTDSTVWTKTEVPATHTQDGSATYTSVYGTVTKVISKEAGAHTYTWVMTTEPTLTEEGQATGTCECGHSATKAIPVLSDSSVWTVDAARHVDSNCKTQGKDVYTSTYGTVEVVLALSENHTWGDWTLTTDPTADKLGTAIHTCSVCQKAEPVSVAVLTDVNVWTIDVAKHVDSDCKTQGKDVYTSIYGTVEVKLALTGNHTWGDWKIDREPTETTVGVASRSCSVCQTMDTKEDVPVLTDSVWDVVTVPASCVATGSQLYSSVYGKVTKVIPLSDEHRWGNWNLIVEPTETKLGTATRVCADNSTHVDTKTDVPVLTDKTWTRTTIAPTHDKDGANTYESVYGTVVVILPKNADAHTYVWTITENPTLEKVGAAQGVCSCGDKATAVLDLNDSDVWTTISRQDATYTSDGAASFRSIYGTVNLVLPRLVAPYEGKTYVSVNIKMEDGKITIYDGWSGAKMVVTGNVGIGEAYPFRGKQVLEVVNDVTGEIKLTSYSIVSSSEEVQYSDIPSAAITCYMDWSTGIFVMPVRSWSEVNVAVPTDAISGSEFSVSCWDSNIAISYNGQLATSILVDGEKAVLGVSFKDIFGKALTGGECASAQSVFVTDAKGNKVAHFAVNPESGKLVVTDGLEGLYTNETLGNVYVNGANGIAVQGNVVNAEAVYVIEGNKVIGAVINNVYYEFVLHGDGMSANGGTCTYATPNVEITLNYNGTLPTGKTENVETLAPTSKNIAIALPTLESESKLFRGWYTDAACTTPVVLTNGKYVPTANTTLYANWRTSVTFTLSGDAEGCPASVVLADGDVFGEYVNMYEMKQIVGTKYFLGWYLEDTFETAIETDQTVSEGDSGITIYAKWADVPAYTGNYYGREMRSVGYDMPMSYVLIDVDGNITSNIEKINGAVVSNYIPAEQKVIYTIGGAEKWFYLDAANGIIAGIAKDDSSIGADYYLLSTANSAESYQPATHYIIDLGQNSDNNAQMLVVGATNVMLLQNKIYCDVTVEDILGESIAIDKLGATQSAIVKDSKGTIVFAVAAAENGTLASRTVALDDIYGAYEVTTGSDLLGDTLVLSGTGKLVGLDATYAIVENQPYLDVYTKQDGAATAYYRVTLSGATAVVVKPVATITFTVCGASTLSIDAMEDVNINIAVDLPTAPTADGVRFRGYYTAQENGEAVASPYLPTQDVTIYAIYDNSVVVTVVYNNGDANGEENAPIDGTLTLADPTFAKHVFCGWYTTPDFQDGTEWVSDTTVVTTAITVYAKWEEAPAFNNNYGAFGFQLTSDNDAAAVCRNWDRLSYGPDIDVLGNATSKGSPFGTAGSTIKVAYVEGSTTDLTITSGSSVYKAVIDPATGVFVMADKSGTDAVIGSGTVWLIAPLDVVTGATYTGSYWNGGASRVISYTVDGTTSLIYVSGNVVKFDVTLEDGEGNAVAITDAHAQTDLIVKKDGTVVATEHPCVSLTIVYGNGMSNQVVPVVAGDTLKMSTYVPAYKDGKIFACWCTDSALTENFTATSISEDTTVYCKWVDSIYAPVSTDSHPWTVNDGVWSTEDYYYSHNSTLKLTFMEAGHVEFDVHVEGGSYSNYYLQVYKNGTDITSTILDSQRKNSSTVEHVALNVAADDYIEFKWTKSSSGYNKYAEILNLVAAEFVPVTLTYKYNDGNTADNVVNMTSWDTVSSLTVVDFKNGNKVFAGWFTKDGTDDDWGVEYVAGQVIVANTTVYAKWLPAVKLTVVYANAPAGKDNINAMTDAVVEYPTGATIQPVAPLYTDGMAFSHWSDTATGEAINWTVITEDKTIYAVWVEANALYGSYVGGEWYYATNGGKFSSRTPLTNKLNVAADGSTGNSYVGTISVIDGVDTASSYHVIADYVSGIIICNYSTGKNYIQKDMWVYIRTDEGATCDTNETLSWGADTTGFSTVARIDLANGNVMLVYFDNDNSKVYGNVTIEVGGVATTSISGLRENNTVFVIKSGSTVLGEFAYKSSGVIQKDSYAGTYTHSDGNAELDGFGNITVTNTTLSLSGATGSYATAASGAGYDFDVVINNENYELTLGAGNTYTLVKPMFTVTFDLGVVFVLTGSADVSTQTINKGKTYTLPASSAMTANGYKFDGWYKEDTFTTKVTSSSAVTANITLYAKWLAAVSVEFNYQDGGAHANATLSTTKYVNDWVYTSDFPTVSFEYNNKVFGGWYTDSACTTAAANFRLTSADAVTLYAKWLSKYTVTINNYSVTDGVAAKTGTYALTVIEGSTPDFSGIVNYIGGQLLVGYYTDGTFTTEYVSAAATADVAVYAKWEDSAAYTITNNYNSDDSKNWSYVAITDTDGSTVNAWQSGVAEVNNGRCEIKVTAIADVTVTLVVRAQGEGSSFDYFNYSVNGTDKQKIVDTTGGSSYDASKINNVAWTTITVDLKAGDVMIMYYRKDGSGDKGADCAQIKSLVVAGDTIVGESVGSTTMVVATGD